MTKCEYCGKEIGLLAVKYTWLDKQNNRAMHDECYEKYMSKSPEKGKPENIEDKAKKIAKEILDLSDDRTLAIQSVIGELMNSQDGEVRSRVYLVAKRVLDHLRIYGESGHITISRFTFPPENIFAGDILLQTFPDKLETNDIVHAIWFEGIKQGIRSYLFTYLSSDGQVADVKDAYGKKIEIPMFWITGKIIKIMPLTSKEGQEFLKKIRYISFIKEDITNDLKSFKDKNVVDELNKRLELIEEIGGNFTEEEKKNGAQSNKLIRLNSPRG